ncbi:MAG TPA: hypothetical protein DEH78_21985 [Solibacterales bacterium]|nr:hypothetical protein [Bryobacterales bacterium]
MKIIHTIILLALAGVPMVGGLTDIPGGYFLFPPVATSTNAAASNITMSAAGSRFAMVAISFATGSINKVYFYTSTTTSTASPTTLDVRVETVDTSTGNPTGILFGANTNCSVPLVDTDDNVEKSCTLTANANITTGDLFAVVIAQPGTGQANFQVKAAGDLMVGIPYGTLDNTGSWVRQSPGRAPLFTLEFAGGRLMNYGGPWATIAADTFNSGTNPAERGNRLTVPVPMRFRGVYFAHSSSWTAGSTGVLQIYEGNSTTPTCSSGTLHTATTSTLGWRMAPMNCSLVLYPGNIYRVTLRATSGTNVELGRRVAGNVDRMVSAPGGATVYRTTLNAGVWTDTTTEQFAIGIIAEALENGAYGRAR